MNLAEASRNCAKIRRSTSARESRATGSASANAVWPTTSTTSRFVSRERERRARREAPRLTQRLAASPTQPSKKEAGKVQKKKKNNNNNINKSVSFSSVDIREYDRTIGAQTDIDGLPLTSDWTYDVREPIAIDEYESNRSPRRPRETLWLSASERRLILMHDFGMSTEILNVVERRLVMQQRLRTIQTSAEKRRYLGKCLDGRPHLMKYI